MAVSEQTPYIEYTANGIATSFALGFTCSLKDELHVLINNVEQSASTWSLANNSVSFNAAPSNGSKVTLYRETKLKRVTDYSSVNNSLRPSALNAELDRVWFALQDQSYKLNQYDFDYSYAINTSNQAKQIAQSAQQAADNAYSLANTTNTETRPINRGGTGSTTAAGARTNLEVYSQSEVDTLIATGGQGNVIGIASGGTGSTTAAGARTNLDVYSKTEANNLFIENTEKGTPNGITPLDANVKVDPIYLPTLPNTAIPKATETALGVVELATQTEVNTGTDDERAITSKKLLAGVKNHLNATGNAPTYACRAWVNFNGTGIVAIRASGNISSITDVGVGRYKANFATVMQDANYAPVVSCIIPSFGLGTPHYCEFSDAVFDGVSVATGNRDAGASNAADFNNIFVGVFR